VYKYWGQCFYKEVATYCSVRAADYMMMYLVDGWQPVLEYRYGCEFGKALNYVVMKTLTGDQVYNVVVARGSV